MSIPGPLLLSAPAAVVSQRTSTIASYVATCFMMIIMTFMHKLTNTIQLPGSLPQQKIKLERPNLLCCQCILPTVLSTQCR